MLLCCTPYTALTADLQLFNLSALCRGVLTGVSVHCDITVGQGYRCHREKRNTSLSAFEKVF